MKERVNNGGKPGEQGSGQGPISPDRSHTPALSTKHLTHGRSYAKEEARSRSVPSGFTITCRVLSVQSRPDLTLVSSRPFQIMLGCPRGFLSHRVLTEVALIAIPDHLVVQLAVMQDESPVTVRAQLVHGSSIVSEARENLIANRCVHALETQRKSRNTLRSALASDFVFGPMPLVDRPGSHLIEKTVAHTVGHQGAAPIVNNGVDMSVQVDGLRDALFLDIVAPLTDLAHS